MRSTKMFGDCPVLQASHLGFLRLTVLQLEEDRTYEFCIPSPAVVMVHCLSETWFKNPSLCLYGTAEINGTVGYGTVFAISGKRFIVQHSFGNSDGAYANAGLLRDANGNLYGTTAFGGDLNCGGGEGCGSVFKLVTNPGNTKPESEPGSIEHIESR